MKFGRANTCLVEHDTKLLKTKLVANSQMNVGGVVIDRATIFECVFNGGVTGLNSLLRDGDITARDVIQIRFGNLRLHFKLQLG